MTHKVVNFLGGRRQTREYGKALHRFDPTRSVALLGTWHGHSSIKPKRNGATITVQLSPISTAREWHVVHNIGRETLSDCLNGCGKVQSYHVVPKGNGPDAYQVTATISNARGDIRLFDKIVKKAFQKMRWGRLGRDRKPFALFSRRAVPLAGIEAFPFRLDPDNQITWADFKAFAKGMRQNVLPWESRITGAVENSAGRYESTGQDLSLDDGRAVSSGKCIEMKIVFGEFDPACLKMAKKIVPALTQSLVGVKGAVVAVDAGREGPNYGFPETYSSVSVVVKPGKGYGRVDILPAVAFPRICIAKGDFGQPGF